MRRLPFALVRLLSNLRALKRRGALVVWMVHNVEPHDMSWKRRLVWGVYRHRLCSLTDGFMTLSPATIDVVRRKIPGLRRKPTGFIWHPSYESVVGTPSRAQARAALGFADSDRVYGLIGQLRPYKGLEALITTFGDLPDQEARLLIAGKPADDTYAASIAALCRAAPRIKLIGRHLSRMEFDAYLAAVDVVVMPSKQSLHSGSILHALSAHRPVLTGDSAFANGLKGQVGAGWVRTFDTKLAVTDLMACCTPDTPPELSAFSVQAMGDKTLAFYRHLLNARPLTERESPAP